MVLDLRINSHETVRKAKLIMDKNLIHTFDVI